MPSSTGRFRSRITRSGTESLTTVSAAAPVTTVSTSKSPARFKVSSMSRPTSGSSSTTTTLLRDRLCDCMSL